MNINNGVKRWEVTAFVCTCWTKTDIMKGSNKRKSFVEHMGMNGSNFKNCVHVKLYRITFRYSFRSGNRCGRVEEWARVTTSMCNNEHESKKRKHTHTYIYIYTGRSTPLDAALFRRKARKQNWFDNSLSWLPELFPESFISASNAAAFVSNWAT